MWVNSIPKSDEMDNVLFCILIASIYLLMDIIRFQKSPLYKLIPDLAKMTDINTLCHY